MTTTKDKLGSALDENYQCPVCGRDYSGHAPLDGIKFCTSDDCPSHPDYQEERS